MTVTDEHEDVASRMRDDFGDNLRAVLVGKLEDGEPVHEEVFLRDSVAEQYTEDDLDVIAGETLLQGTEKPYQESLYQLGDLRYTTQRFEGAVLMNFPDPETERRTVVVSVDADAVGDELHSVADDCAELLGV